MMFSSVGIHKSNTNAYTKFSKGKGTRSAKRSVSFHRRIPFLGEVVEESRI